jgi:hypothetical protein
MSPRWLHWPAADAGFPSSFTITADTSDGSVSSSTTITGLTSCAYGGTVLSLTFDTEANLNAWLVNFTDGASACTSSASPGGETYAFTYSTTLSSLGYMYKDIGASPNIFRFKHNGNAADANDTIVFSFSL